MDCMTQEDRILTLSNALKRALQTCRTRVVDAFQHFSGDDEKDSRLELTEVASLPLQERGMLPYADRQFDWVACYELMEHVGTPERQVRLLRELLRVANKGIFVSAINHWHPLDLQGMRAPLVHWLHPSPKLVPLDAARIKAMINVLPGKPDWQLGHVRLAGFKSHYFLMIRKPDPQPFQRSRYGGARLSR
jgi:SAM-dependent methyltransferase